MHRVLDVLVDEYHLFVSQNEPFVRFFPYFDKFKDESQAHELFVHPR